MGTNTKRKDGRIGDRITFEQSDDQLRVDIRQGIPPTQMSLLTLWLLLWFSLEAVVLYFWTQEPSQGNASLGYAIYSAFWAFFAFRISKVWLWRKRGVEVITVDRRGISVANAFGQRGLPDFIAHGAYSPIRRIEENPQQILRTFEQAFWSMGGETLQFSSGKRTMVLAKAAISSSCVTIRMVMPSPFRRVSNCMISIERSVSRLPVGSSASSTSGCVTSARAIATRCCCPPDNSAGV